MKEKVLEKTVSKNLTQSTRRKIDERLKKLSEESTWDISHQWNKQGNKLCINSGKLVWEVVFSKGKMEIYVDGPVHLKLFFAPFRKMALEVIVKEIDELLN